MATTTKNVILKDTDGAELLPQTTASQIRTSSGGTELFKYDSSTNTLSLEGESTLNGESLKDNSIPIGKIYRCVNHNNFVRGKDITSYFNDGTIWDRIAGKNGFKLFEDLYLGDWFKIGTAITAPGSSVDGTDHVMIAGFNLRLGLGGEEGRDPINDPHLIMVPGDAESGVGHFGEGAMASSSTISGGYVNSDMHQSIYGADTDHAAIVTTEGSINYQLYKVFGDHLMRSREMLTNITTGSRYNRTGTNSGGSSSALWYPCYAVNMGEVEFYGTIVWSSSGADTGSANRQLPLFARADYPAALLGQDRGFWLKDVATASAYCAAGTTSSEIGMAWYENPTIKLFVCPRFILGTKTN